jgi:predicted histidine transporter YuiF (NhaC family)
MIFVAIGAAAGVLLALFRGHVLLAIVASAFFAAVVALFGLWLGHSFVQSALVGCGSIAAVQLCYMALGLALEPFRAENYIPQIQDSIGQQLRAELELPRCLPPKMANLVAQLEAA